VRRASCVVRRAYTQLGSETIETHTCPGNYRTGRLAHHTSLTGG